MKINTFEECKEEYKTSFKDNIGWDESDSKEREKMLASFPSSVVVQGNYLEHDMAIEQVQKKIGLKERKWDEIWYGKIGYDYGFWEFFFKDKEDSEIFKNLVSTFYAETEIGKWKTDGYENHVDIS